MPSGLLCHTDVLMMADVIIFPVLLRVPSATAMPSGSAPLYR